MPGFLRRVMPVFMGLGVRVIVGFFFFFGAGTPMIGISPTDEGRVFPMSRVVVFPVRRVRAMRGLL